MTATAEATQKITSQTTSTLVDTVEYFHDHAMESEGNRRIYAIAAGELAQRLNIDVHDAINSIIGPADYMRFVYEMRG